MRMQVVFSLLTSPKAVHKLVRNLAQSSDPVSGSVFCKLLHCPSESTSRLHIGKNKGDFGVIRIIAKVQEWIALMDEVFKLFRFP